MSFSIQNKSGNDFIDENHARLLDRLNVLTESLRGNWQQRVFLKSTADFIRLLEGHFTHEETVLRGVDFDELESHIALHRDIAHRLKVLALDIRNYDTASEFVMLARSDILNHELVHDQAYWKLFEPQSGATEQIIVWSSDLETGNTEIDQHHQSLANFINRISILLTESIDRERACSELRSLYAYSRLHFDEEKETMGKHMSAEHLLHDKSLLHDLIALITEIGTENYPLNNVGSHLKYWFLNHLHLFDIPTIKKSI